tara:strand:- start:458 stop:805 length:348 start_codon:yes stop_codon:yes gene_type:complete
MASAKEVMRVMLPQIESMMDQKVDSLTDMITDVLKKNGMNQQGDKVPELKTESDAKLDALTEKILGIKADNPTAGLVMVKGRNGRTTMIDTYSDVLADIKDEQDGRYKQRRKSRH